MIQLCCLLKFRSDAKAAITGPSSAAPVALWDKIDYTWHFAPIRDLVPSMLTSLCKDQLTEGRTLQIENAVEDQLDFAVLTVFLPENSA